jgi:hypothetical protein
MLAPRLVLELVAMALPPALSLDVQEKRGSHEKDIPVLHCPSRLQHFTHLPAHRQSPSCHLHVPYVL